MAGFYWKGEKDNGKNEKCGNRYDGMGTACS